MTFLDELRNVHNNTLTENGAAAFKGTLDANLDLFALAGAMRGRPEEAVRLFRLAWAENPLLAVRCAFYLRDVRGGQGERNIFRKIMSELFVLDRKVAISLLEKVAEYGRWDDIFNVGADVSDYANLLASQLSKDTSSMMEGQKCSLLAKWMPSENASSLATKALARAIAKEMGLSSAVYRRRIVSLRRHIKLLEQKMSEKKWDEVEYDKLPSLAFKTHTKAFKRNDGVRYADFLTKVAAGEKKVNSGALFTYEIYDLATKGDAASAEALWRNLPDWTNGKNAIVVADVSVSMSGRPMSVSVSLALYFAERNKGAFNGYFLTFSDDSQLVKVAGKTLYEKMRNLEAAPWGGSTNLMSSFKAILNAALAAKAKPEEIPSTIYIISDMEFNCVADGVTPLAAAKQMFNTYGYELPSVVFWNVNSRNTQVPATKSDKNVTLISGCSQSTFRYAVEGKTPVESMMEVLASERYASISI